MAASVWPSVHVERAALAADLDSLTAEQWATPSLCAGWNVHQVLAHMVATARTSAPQFLGQLVKAGFSFTKFVDKGVAAASAGGPAATLEAWRALGTDTTSPPGPKVSWLGEILIHAEDIRRPLGLTRHYPAEPVIRTLDFYKGSNAIVGAKKRAAGLTLKATDADWTHGEGPLVEGPAISLLMAVTGRKSALDDLTGPGVEQFRSR